MNRLPDIDYIGIKDGYNYKMKRLEFNGASDILKYITSGEEIKYNINDLRDFSKITYEEAKEYLLHGKKDYSKEYNDMLNDIEYDECTCENEYRYTDNGLFYDMGSVVEGLPENMLINEIDTNKKEYNIIIDIMYGCQISNNIINNRGKAIFKLLYTLISKNYNINIQFKGLSLEYKTRKNIKKAIEIVYNLPKNELNIPTIAFLCSSEFYRGIHLAIVRTEGISNYLSYGDSKLKLQNNDILFGGGYIDLKMNDLMSINQANEYITNRYNKQIKAMAI